MNKNKICPKCGSTNTHDHFIRINDKFASTYPIKHNWRCHDCGWDDRNPKTNFDKVRKMTPEQFASWMAKQITTSLFVSCPFDREERLKNAWLSWLNEEVEE